MIRIEQLSKKFKNVGALDRVSISIPDNSAVALIGPNASGKTTLIKCMLGLVVPDSGSIFINDVDTHRNWKYRNSIGYMPQIGRYPENMTIHQLLKMIADLRRISLEDCDNDLIKKFEIESIQRKALGTLSGGTRQKVSACLAFLFDPQILILDEPTAGLDPVSSETLKAKILKERRKGKTVLVTSHVLSDLDELTDEVILLEEGRIKFQRGINHLKEETGEEKLSRVIAKLMGYNHYEEVI